MPSAKSLLKRVEKIGIAEEMPRIYIERGYRTDEELEVIRKEARDMDVKGIIVCRFYRITS